MNDCIISIGSNIDASRNIHKTLDILTLDFSTLDISEFISTKPIGIEDQPDFTNGAVRISTDLEYSELQEYLKKLEDQLGRDRSLPKFGPRTIDLDIIVWNGNIIDDDYYTREFLQTACEQLGFYNLDADQNHKII